MIVLTTAVLGFFEWNRYQDLKNMYRGHIDNIARSKALLLSEPLWNVDNERAELSLKGVVADNHVSAAALYDEDGTLFVG